MQDEIMGMDILPTPSSGGFFRHVCAYSCFDQLTEEVFRLFVEKLIEQNKDSPKLDFLVKISKEEIRTKLGIEEDRDIRESLFMMFCEAGYLQHIIYDGEGVEPFISRGRVFQAKNLGIDPNHHDDVILVFDITTARMFLYFGIEEEVNDEKKK